MSVMFSTHSNTFASFHLRPYPMFQDKEDAYQRKDRDFSLSDFRSSLSLNYLHTELLFLVQIRMPFTQQQNRNSRK